MSEVKVNAHESFILGRQAAKLPTGGSGGTGGNV